jgi:O-antigen/teichoic acid export membrane protein
VFAIWHKFSSGYTRHALILVIGSVVSQGLMIGLSPVLTRLYEPAVFGLFALFMSIVGLVNPMVCGKFDVALVLPEKDEDSVHLTGLAVRFAFGVSLLLLAVSILFYAELKALMRVDRLGTWYYLTALALLLSGLFQVLLSVSNRFQQYVEMARANVASAVANILVKISTGLMHLGLSGLILGQLVGLLVGIGYLYAVQKRKWLGPALAFSPAKKALFKKYRDFPFYNATSGLLGGLLLSMPVFFIAYRYTEDLLGQFALTMRVIMIPSAFLSAAISQVNLKRVVDLVNAGRSPVPFVLKSSACLGGLVLLPMAVLWKFGSPLFLLIFGEEWGVAGEMAAILAWMVVIRFVASTMSSVLSATNNNLISAGWRVTTVFTMAGVFAWSGSRGDIYFFLKAYAVHDAVMYTIIWCCTLWAAAHPRNLLEKDIPSAREGDAGS